MLSVLETLSIIAITVVIKLSSVITTKASTTSASFTRLYGCLNYLLLLCC